MSLASGSFLNDAQFVIRRFMMGAIAFCFIISLPLLGLAMAQGFDQSAVLTSPQPEAPIPIAIRPAPNQPVTGYGLSGKAITVIEQIGDYMDFDDPSATWCHIRLEEKPYTEGWIQGKFVAFETSAQ